MRRKEPMDWAGDLIFLPWSFAEGKGRLIGWPLMALGMVWVLLLSISVGFPMMIAQTVLDMDRELRKKGK